MSFRVNCSILPAQTSVLLDRYEACNPILLLHLNFGGTPRWRIHRIWRSD